MTLRGSTTFRVVLWAAGFLALLAVLRAKPWAQARQATPANHTAREILKVGFLPVT